MDLGSRKLRVTKHKVKEELRGLFVSQPLAVLSTSDDGQPYCNLIAFAPDDDIAGLIFATVRATRKFANMANDSRVSLLIDNRSNQVSDFRDAMAVTVTGRASELSREEKGRYLKLFLDKHPYLQDFVMSPGCALMRVQVERYYIVKRFRNVMILTLTP